MRHCLLFALVLLLPSCTLFQPHPPEWMNNPPANSGVGIAGPNIGGIPAQISLATHRASIDYAKRKGYLVESSTLVRAGADGKIEWEELEENSNGTMEATKVQVEVRERWYDGHTNYYVLVTAVDE